MKETTILVQNNTTEKLMENEFTAVEWLFSQLYEKFEMKGDGEKMNEVLEEAKEMEREQISKAWEGGSYAYFYSKETGTDFDNGEQYYNEIYGK